MYEPRLYREKANRERFFPTRLVDGESDLWIGIDRESESRFKKDETERFLSALRKDIINYIRNYPEFSLSHSPIPELEDDPGFARAMKKASKPASTGPMAGIAGYIAGEVAGFIKDNFNVREVVVENGGDIAACIAAPLYLKPDAGKNTFFSGMAVEVLQGGDILGICSSSGMFGHSFSYGKADLVMVIAGDPCLADVWATSLANRIQDKKDVEELVNKLPEGLDAVLAIKDDKMAYIGNYRIVRSF